MDFTQFFYLAFAAAGVSVTLSRSSFFSWLRNFFATRGWYFPWKVLACLYCCVHWVTAGMILLYYVAADPGMVDLWRPYAVPFFIFWFAMVTVSSILAGIIDHLIGFSMQGDKAFQKTTRADFVKRSGKG